MVEQKRMQYRKLKRKILILRIEEIFLLVIIGVLLISNPNIRNFFTGDDGDIPRVDAVSKGQELQLTKENMLEQYKWLLNNEDLFPEDKVMASENNPGLINFLYKYGKEEYKISNDIEISKEEMNGEIPLFMQWDDRWGYDSYGSSVVGITGCGPTCLAMVVDGLNKKAQVTPRDISNYAMENNYYVPGTGTKWALFSDYAAEYNIKCLDLRTDAEWIFTELEAGNPVICSMGAGTFTTGGHFIVLVGMEDGKIIVNDPNSTELSSKKWELEDFSDEIVNAWSFY